MNYSNSYNKTNNNDIIIISNKEKIYQNHNLSILNNNYDNNETYEMLQNKISELNNRIDFIKNNCIGIISEEDISIKINSIVQNIDLVIEQINYKIINKAQIHNYKKIIINENL